MSLVSRGGINVYPGGGNDGQVLVNGDIKDGVGVVGVCVVGGRRGGGLGTGYGAVVGGIEDYEYRSWCGGCVVGQVNRNGRGRVQRGGSRGAGEGRV